jgi:phosphoribosylaminoimidazole carboxylase
MHWYGKDSIRPGRKVGHITIVASSVAMLLERAARLVPSISCDHNPNNNQHSNSNQNLNHHSNSNQLPPPAPPLVGIIMGSDSDLPTMSAAATVLEQFGVPYELSIVSAHRTPARMYRYASEAHSRGLEVIIAGAGGAAHLPGKNDTLNCRGSIRLPTYYGHRDSALL